MENGVQFVIMVGIEEKQMLFVDSWATHVSAIKLLIIFMMAFTCRWIILHKIYIW